MKPKRTSYSRSITQLMKDATNPDPICLIKSLQNEEIKKTLFQKDEKGRTALDWARLTRNYQAITILINVMSTAINNARVNSINSFDKIENLIIQTNKAQGIELREAIRTRNSKLAEQILVDNKLVREEVEALGQVFFTDWVGKVGYSPLILASGMNMKEVVRELINLRVPINQENRYGHTALTIAANAGNADIAYFLLFNGANVYHKTKENRTALHYACLYAKAKVVKVILDHLLERFATFRNDDHSLTEFDYTRWNTYATMVDNLLNIRDNENRTALESLPVRLEDMYRIEKRIKLSGGTGLKKLNQKPRDNRSLDMNLSLTNIDEDFESTNFQANGDDDLFEHSSVGTPLNEDNENVLPSNQKGEGDDFSELSSVDNSSNQISYPEWSHVTDDQGVLEFHNIQDIFSVKSSMPLEKEVAYIQEQFAKVKERIIQWLINADKEKALVQLIKCPLDCGVFCKTEDLTNHVRDDCPHRTLQCALCHEIIRFMNVKQHDLHECKNRTITCSNCFHYMKACELDRHLRMLCNRRIVRCRLICDLALPYDERDNHELEHCPNRIITCDQCKQEMTAAEYGNHLLEKCPERFVRCTVGCGESFKAKDIQNHEENICTRYCKWGCGKKIGPPVQLRYHEHSECYEKPAVCCYSCSIPNLTVGYKKDHEKFNCPNRPVYCTKGCGKRLHSKDLYNHIDMFRGDCPERQIICPSNLIGWKILLPEEHNSIEGIVMRYERKFIHERDDSLSSDEIYVKTAKGHFWFNIWKTKIVLLAKQSYASEKNNDIPSSSSSSASSKRQDHYIDKHLSCPWMCRMNLRKHLELECIHRKVFVKNTTVVTELNPFVPNLIPPEQNPFLTAKGQKIEVNQANDLSNNLNSFDEFQQYLYNPDYYQCNHCGNYLLKTFKEEHLDNECDFITVFCPIGCGHKFKRKEILKHAQFDCPKRNVICQLCSRNDLWAEELEQHKINECTHRFIPCSLECGNSNIKECDMPKHQAEECPNRPIQCDCGLAFPSKELLEHKKLNCINRLVGCPQGCGEVMALFLIDNHIEYFCTNRNHIYDRIEECPNGCGISMMRKELLQHVTTDCPKRLIECTLYCGNTCAADLLTKHLVTCPNRVLCCEPNLNMCARKFHEWFFKEPNSLPSPPPPPHIRPFDENNPNGGDPADPTFQLSSLEINSTMNQNAEDRLEHIKQYSRALAGNDSDKEIILPQAKDNTLSNDIKRDTLYEGNNITIEVSNTGNFFANLKVKRIENKFGESNQNAGNDFGSSEFLKKTPFHQIDLNETSSIYYEQHSMKFKDSLRMCFCDKHCTSILMSSIRYNQLALTEFIIRQVKESSDIDRENIYGDTALTLACRLGRLEYVELLVQNGADINKETSNGRTALIEAVKSDQEHIPLIEYLIKEGCIVAYKTKRHGRTSLDWARRYAISEEQALIEKYAQNHPNDPKKFEITHEKRRILGRPRTVRILELAAVVQRQSNILFTKIALGENEFVLKAIENGDFFDALTEEKCYKYMEEFVIKSEECDQELNEIQLKLGSNTSKIDLFHEKKISLNKQILEINDKLSYCYANEKEWDSKINIEFINFEKSLNYILTEDIEEIARFSKPSNILLLTLYFSGVILEFFPKSYEKQSKEYEYLYAEHLYQKHLKNNHSNNKNDPMITKEFILQQKGIWWYKILIKLFLIKSLEIKHKLNSFTRAKLHVERSKDLFHLVRFFLKMLNENLNEESNLLKPSALAAMELTQTKFNNLQQQQQQTQAQTGKSERKKNDLKNQNDNDGGLFSPAANKAALMAYVNSNRPAASEIPEDPDALPVPYEDFVNPRPKSRGKMSGTTSPTALLDRLPSSPSLTRSSSMRRPSSSNRKKTKEEIELEALEKEYFEEDDDTNTLQGSWIKGEWVPKLKKKHKQPWELEEGEDLLTELHKEQEIERLLAIQQEEFEKNADRLMYLTDEMIQENKMKTLEELRFKQQTKFTEAVVEFDFGNQQQLQDRNSLDIPLLLDGSAPAWGNNEFDDGDESVSIRSPLRRQSSLLSRASFSQQNSPPGSAGSPMASPKLLRRKSSMRSVNSTNSKDDYDEDSLTNNGNDNDDDAVSSAGNSIVNSPSPKLSRRKSSRRLSSSNNNSGNSSPSKRKEKKKRKKDKQKTYENEDEYLLSLNPLENYQSDQLVGFAYIQTIILLCKAIIKFDIYYNKILLQKNSIFKYVSELEDLKNESISTIEEYEKQMAIRSKNEKEYIKLLKKNKFIQEKLFIFRDRVRIARLMNHISVSGHTLISWTAAYGNYEIFEAMLSRGGTVGFNNTLLHLTATYLQISYKIYRVMCRKYDINASMKGGGGGGGGAAVLTIDGAAGLLKKAANIQIIQELTKLKDIRAKLLLKIHYLKHKMRFPIPEAIYAGNWEIVQRVYDRRLWHCHFMNTWAFPQPPPPFTRDLSHIYEHKKLTPIEILTYAMNTLASGAYIAEKGWVPPNHPLEPYGELSIVLEKILFECKEKQLAYRANRYRIRALSNERKNQKSGEAEMAQSIYKRDYRHCIFLAENRGITIDLETPDGSTALISAAEEDADALNHEYMINDDGSRCLQVEYLLDRHYYRPAINLETSVGYTALLRACVLGRTHVVVALLDRGANINYVNRYGKAAIHYVAALGHSEVMRILVERFADLTIKDNHGRTAYEIAEKENYTNLMTLLSQFRSGYLGALQLTRGRVNNQLTCPNGCGKVLFIHEKKPHLLECIYRLVPCPNGCGKHDLQFKELTEHVNELCDLRKIPCEKCHEEIALGEIKLHDEEQCIYRKVSCPLKCDKEIIFCEVTDHLKLKCIHRKLPCILYCNESIREIDMSDHVENHCSHRRVTCPNKCHHQIIAYQLDLHLSSLCPNRMILCNQCNDPTIIFKEYDYHFKELCPYRPVPCPEKCGTTLPICELAQHLLDACLHKCITCPNHCSYQIQRKYLQNHLLKECENRFVSCPNQCINHELSTYQETIIQTIPAKLLSMHMKSECPERLICCSLCQLQIKSKYLSLHQSNDCLQRIVKCSNDGCCKEISFQLLNQHEFHECRFRKLPCPQGCGQIIPWIYSKPHMQKECTMRFITCTLQCGEKLRIYDLDGHLQDACPRRFTLSNNNGSTKYDPYALQASIKKNKSLLPDPNATTNSTGTLKRHSLSDSADKIAGLVASKKKKQEEEEEEEKKKGILKKKGSAPSLSTSSSRPRSSASNNGKKKSNNDEEDEGEEDDEDDDINEEELAEIARLQEQLRKTKSSFVESFALLTSSSPLQASKKSIKK